MEINQITEQIIGAAIEVHKYLGPGLLESAYRRCLARELTLRRLRVEEERPLPVEYKGELIDVAYRLDLVVEGIVVVELKCIEAFQAIHSAQLITYLKLSGMDYGLLINFNSRLLRNGIKRITVADQNK